MASISLALPAQAPALAVLLLLGACGGGTAPPAASPSSSVAAADASSPSARALASALQADAGGEQTVVLQQGLNGYSGTADAYVFSSHNALNFGAAETLNDKSADRTRFRSLVRFAIFQSEGGPVPDGANISAATLSLYKSSSYDTKYQLRPVIADWVEGEVTWDQRRQGVPWTGPGATAAGSDIAVSSDGTADAPKTPSWVAFDVTTGVQAIADGRSNRGWMLDPISGNGNVKTFHSSEYTADGSLRPMLSVRFTVTSSNAPPNISLTAPAASQSFAVGDIITLSAAASDSDGSISRVEFYADGVKLGEDSSAPYSMSWSGAAIGNHVLSAIAHDNLGASKTSASVTVTVTQASSGIEQTVTLRDGLNGYTGTADAYIFSAHNALNFGAAQVLQDKAEGSGGNTFRSLMKFAIFQSEGGPVPDGATITAATLSLYKVGPYSTVYHLRPLLTNWVESEVSWAQSRQGVPWAAPGATAEGSDIAASSDGTGEAPKAAGWVSFDVSSGIQAMSGGRVNRGWMLHPVSGNGNIKAFHSSEYADDTSLRPSLTLRYRTASSPPPGGMAPTSCRDLNLSGFCIDVYDVKQLEATSQNCPTTEVCRIVVHPGQYDLKASLFTYHHWFRHFIGIADAQGNRPTITSYVGSVFANKGSQSKPLNIILQDLVLAGPSPGVDFDGATGEPYLNKGGLSWLNRVKIDVENRPVLFNTGPNPGGGSFWCTGCEIVSHVTTMIAITEIDSAWISDSRLTSAKWNNYTISLGARSVGLQNVTMDTGAQLTCGQYGITCRSGSHAAWLRAPTLAWFEALVEAQTR